MTVSYLIFGRTSVIRIVALALTTVMAPTVMRAAKPAGGGGGKCPAGSVSQGPGGYCIIPVTTIINDVDSNGLSATVASDGLGPYGHGVNGVSSLLTENGYNRIAFGDWQFDVYGSLTRVVDQNILVADAVQPGDPHYTAPASPPFGFGTQASKTHMEVKCTLVNRNMLTMPAGSSFTCPLLNRFNVSGQDYGLSPAYSFNNYPEVTDAQVRCNTANSGGCNDWSITPIGLGQAVGRLVTGGTAANDGDFYMRFNIHITRP